MESERIHIEDSSTSVLPTAKESSDSTSTERPLATPERVPGEVSLTPTHRAYTPLPNPHGSLLPLTPAPAEPAHNLKATIKIQNCVSSVNLGCELKLLDIYCRTRYCEYNPARFHGIVMRILEPRATALVFRSGKLVCTGTRTEHDSYMASRKFARIIQKLGFPVKFSGWKVQNLIATADARHPLRLEALQAAHGQFAAYEPELFPGLVYRLVRPRLVLLAFCNGKLVLTGAKTRADLHDALDLLHPILRTYRKR